MKKGLLLPGYACKSWIWENVKDMIKSECNIKLIDWPTNITSDFHSLENFANWIYKKEIEDTEPYDFIIGHSMGGLVALHLAKMKPKKVKNVILVESFITTPSRFFQNLMMKDTSKELVDKTIDMLKEEKNFYSGQLNERLKDLDLSDLIFNIECEISAIYGDRGCNDGKKVLSELQWSRDIQAKIDFNIVHNSCHFPMLENPNETIALIKKVL